MEQSWYLINWALRKESKQAFIIYDILDLVEIFFFVRLLVVFLFKHQKLPLWKASLIRERVMEQDWF